MFSLLTVPTAGRASSASGSLYSVLITLPSLSLKNLLIGEKTSTGSSCTSSITCVDEKSLESRSCASSIATLRRGSVKGRSTRSPSVITKVAAALEPVLTVSVQNEPARDALLKAVQPAPTQPSAHAHLSRSTGLKVRVVLSIVPALSEFDWTKDSILVTRPHVAGLTGAGRRKLVALHAWLNMHLARLGSREAELAAFMHGVAFIQSEEPREREFLEAQRHLPRRQRSLDYSPVIRARSRVWVLMNDYLAEHHPRTPTTSRRARCNARSVDPMDPTSPLAMDCTAALRAPAPRRVRFDLAPECTSKRPNLSAHELFEAAEAGHGMHRFAVLNAAALRCASAQ